MRRSFVVTVSVFILSSFTVLGAQSLADVARKEEQRRKGLAKTSRVYTNEDLGAAGIATEAAPGPASGTANAKAAADGTADAESDAEAEEETSPKEGAIAPRVKRDEKYWRGRAQQFREVLGKMRADVQAIETRIESLRARPESPATAAEIAQAEDDLKRFRSELSMIEADWGRFQDRARNDKASDWIQ